MAQAADNRWTHRPHMDWSAAARRHDPRTVEGRLFAGFRHPVDVRRRLPQLHVASPLAVVDLGEPALSAFIRSHPAGPLLAVVNLTERLVTLPGGFLADAGLPVAHDALDPANRVDASRAVVLPPYAARWFVAEP
jgi:amylosucrase